MEKAVERGLDWAGMPVIATVARLLCQSQRYGTSTCGLMADNVRATHTPSPPQTRTAPLAMGRSRGFTLIELLVVIAIGA
jgi:prepilin-type N-terminal cleavage/methylation domain-containing protein